MTLQMSYRILRRYGTRFRSYTATPTKVPPQYSQSTTRMRARQQFNPSQKNQRLPHRAITFCGSGKFLLLLLLLSLLFMVYGLWWTTSQDMTIPHYLGQNASISQQLQSLLENSILILFEFASLVFTATLVILSLIGLFSVMTMVVLTIRVVKYMYGDSDGYYPM